MNFDLKTAKDYASRDQLDDWVHTYLTTGYWKNIGLSDGLKLRKRWWIGPVEMPLSQLKRVCGPEPEMAYIEAQDIWEKRIQQLVETLTDVTALPPLIVQYRDGEYSVRDGSHRHEAMHRKRWQSCWVIIWYDNEAQWEHANQSDGV